MPEPSETVKSLVTGELANPKNREQLKELLQELDERRQADRDRIHEEKIRKKRNKQVAKVCDIVAIFAGGIIVGLSIVVLHLV